MEHLRGTAVHANAVHADDLLYLGSIFLERQLMPVQCMQMTFYIYVACTALACAAVPGKGYIYIKGHLHVLHWHELPFQEDAT
jgi:hypothetical protein